jgi:hypothetical protein
MRHRREEFVLEMAGRLGLLGQRLCAHRSDDQVLVGFAHLGHALVLSSFDVRGSYAAPVLGASPRRLFPKSGPSFQCLAAPSRETFESSVLADICVVYLARCQVPPRKWQ